MNDKPDPLAPWYGGKARMAPIIAEKIDNIQHKIYLEPFGGMAGVLMKKRPSKIEIYNDLTDALIILFRVVRDKEQCQELIRRLEFTPYARTEWRDANHWKAQTDPVEQARMIYVLLTQNFSGLLKGGSWSFGGPKHNYNKAAGFFTTFENISSVCKRLRNVLIEHGQALTIMKQWDGPETIIYADPPYVPETRSGGADRYPHEMTLDDHIEMIEWLLNAESKIILSGYPSPLYIEKLESCGWLREDYDAIAHSAVQTTANGLKGKSSDIAKRTECLWINPAAQVKTLWNFQEAI